MRSKIIYLLRRIPFKRFFDVKLVLEFQVGRQAERSGQNESYEAENAQNDPEHKETCARIEKIV